MDESLQNGQKAQSLGEAQTSLEASDGQAQGTHGSNPAGNGSDAGQKMANIQRGRRSTTPTGEEVEAELAALSRGPFRRILTDFLGFAPDADSIKRLSANKPEKWAASLAILAQLAGYKRDVIEVNNIVMIGSMSDYELNKRLAEVEGMGKESARLISPSQPVTVPQHLAPSRDPDVIDVQATTINKEAQNE